MGNLGCQYGVKILKIFAMYGLTVDTFSHLHQGDFIPPEADSPAKRANQLLVFI